MKSLVIVTAGLLLMATNSAIAGDNVARAIFTHGIVDREPVDQIGQLSNDYQKVYFFTELRDLAGHTVTHRWQHGEEVVAEVQFEVRGDRWRVWSSKKLKPEWLGKWAVTVLDANGTIMAEENMAYVPAAEVTTMEPPEIIDATTEHSP